MRRDVIIIDGVDWHFFDVEDGVFRVDDVQESEAVFERERDRVQLRQLRGEDPPEPKVRSQARMYKQSQVTDA